MYTYNHECISEKLLEKTFTAPRLQNYAEEVGHVTRANNYGNSVRHRRGCSSRARRRSTPGILTYVDVLFLYVKYVAKRNGLLVGRKIVLHVSRYIARRT